MIKISNDVRCPISQGVAKIVWISKDNHRAGIKCSASHKKLRHHNSKLSSAIQTQSKLSKNIVFLVDVLRS